MNATMSSHGATYEWDGASTAVRCICGFYRIAESHDVAEREYMNHVDVAAVGGVTGEQPHA